MSIHDLRAKRATIFDAYRAIGEKADFDKAKDQTEFDRLKGELADADAEIDRAKAIQEAAAKSAQPVEGQDPPAARLPATVNSDPYTSHAAAEGQRPQDQQGADRRGCAKMIGEGGGNIYNARAAAKEKYGENHPVTKALLAGVGASGGFIVPPDYVERDHRASAPDRSRARGRPARAADAARHHAPARRRPALRPRPTAPRTSRSRSAQPKVGAIVASYKKLTALVPISNDLMRYADPAADAFVRDDLVKVIALREDLAFMLGDGTQDTPRGFISFANGFAVGGGGSVGVWSSIANSTFATGGNFITSNPTYTLATVAVGTGRGDQQARHRQRARHDSGVWFMHPRSFNYLIQRAELARRLRLPRRTVAAARCSATRSGRRRRSRSTSGTRPGPTRTRQLHHAGGDDRRASCSTA